MHTLFGKGDPGLRQLGESWELSGVEGSVSVVRNGFLAGNELPELLEVFMGDLAGELVYERFGNRFPLLVKFLDAHHPLSVQVHPGDGLAARKHRSTGKTEMWYVLAADPGSLVWSGFREGVDRKVFLDHLGSNSLTDILHAEPVRPGDVLYIPSGRIHAVGAGVTLCEIQQPADVTYRLYDWNRSGMDGRPRPLHIQEALEALDFSACGEAKTHYTSPGNGSVPLVVSPHFHVNLVRLDKVLAWDYFYLDSFVVYVCLEGRLDVRYPGGRESLIAGETLLLPAEFKNVELHPLVPSALLEAYLPPP